MALKTVCSTPGAIYSIHINPTSVEVKVNLPMCPNLTEAQASQLEDTIHNAMEMALTPIFIQDKLEREFRTLKTRSNL